MQPPSNDAPPETPRKQKLWIWFLWLGLFYAAWLLVVILDDSWGAVRDHWPIAAAMAAGSYVAGSTPMGGGTVGFPVLVLFFDMPASLGRDFGFVCQSIGMVSASIFILARRQIVAWGILRWAFGTALIVTPLSLNFVAPYLPPDFITVMFAVMWASFGIMHFTNLTEILKSSRVTTEKDLDAFWGILIGAVGGISASLTGVGIDMLVYVVMVSLMRVDVRVAIPTSVIIMALTSLIGVASTLLFGEMPRAAYENWLAAAPVVALGAPLGAFVVAYISRSKTLLFVSSLCIVQFVWTLIDKSVTGWSLVLALLGVAVLNIAFRALYAAGAKYAAVPVSVGLPADPEVRSYAAGVRDEVSGAYVQTYFLDRGQQEYMASTRHKREMSVVWIQIMNSSALHDPYDNAPWEACLRGVVERIATISRTEDVCARFGEDAFAILMPDTTKEGAQVYADRLANVLSERMLIESDKIMQLETRVSVASRAPSHGSFSELVEEASRSPAHA